MKSDQQTDHPVLLIIRGLPGSGKSYLAAAIRKELGVANVVMLDPDATDYDSPEYAEHVRKQTEDGVDPKLHAYRYLRAQAHQGIEGHKLIMWNQPFTNLEIFNKMIANLQGHAAECGTYLPVLVVEVEVDHEVARGRVVRRKQEGGHGPSEATFDRFKADYQTFADKGYQVVAVYGDADVRESVAAVVAAVRPLLEETLDGSLT